MSSDQEDVVDMAELLEKLDQEAKISAKQRVFNISRVVNKVCEKAYQDGLTHASLAKLVDIITLPNRLEQGSLAALIRNLYPASKVPDAIVIKVVGSLGHGRVKVSLTSQGLLLKWLVMVYDVLQNQSLLSQLYSVIFNLLDTTAIRPQLCHLLSLITRRKHVRPYRIQILMELMRQAGNEPPLVGLLRVYKDYYPDVIVGDTSGRASVFMQPNQEWREHLHAIQEGNSRKEPHGLPSVERAFRVQRKSANAARMTQSSTIPEVHTSHAQESSVTLEEIESVYDFIQKLEIIEPPNQLVAVVNDPLLQKFLQLRSSESSLKRVDDWLLAFFEDQLQNPHSAEAKILEMLQAILEYTRYSKVIPSACLKYLTAMLPTWNGSMGREVILQLLSYIPLGPFEALYPSLFQLVEDAVLGDGTNIDDSRLALLVFYHTLLSRWDILLLSSSNNNPTPSSAQAVTSLTTHIYDLCLTLLASSATLNVHSTVLSVLETLSSLHSTTSLQPHIRITIPPAPLIYILGFTPSLTTSARLCAILALHKRAFETHGTKRHHAYPKPYLNKFNGYLMDLCNCYWRMRALTTVDPNALGCLVSPTLVLSLSNYTTSLDRELVLQNLFGLPHNVLTCNLADAYLRAHEDEEMETVKKRHLGPVTSKSLEALGREGGVKLGWTEYRVGILRYLGERGVTGIGDLMRTTVKGVMDSTVA